MSAPATKRAAQPIPEARFSGEALLEISEADARAEGVDYVAPGEDPIEGGGYAFFDGACIGASSARDAFGPGWDHVYGKRQGCAWADNPWVWVVEFRRVEVAP
jgi:hypothetical protein